MWWPVFIDLQPAQGFRAGQRISECVHGFLRLTWLRYFGPESSASFPQSYPQAHNHSDS